MASELVIKIDADGSSAHKLTADQYVLAGNWRTAKKVPGVGRTREVNR